MEKCNENNQNQATRLTQAIRIKKCLKYSGITQKELADKLGISPQSVSYFVRGVRGIPASHVDSIADILNVNREYLMLKSDFMTNTEKVAAFCDEPSNVNDACFNLISTLGFKIREKRLRKKGVYSAMYLPYNKIVINKNDTDTEILEKAHNFTPIRVYEIIAPEGKCIQVTQEQLRNIVNQIKAYAIFMLSVENDNIEP